MSSLPSGFEPPAPEDWGQRSLAELREMLKRQERLLRNEKFICRLPDKGKKISDSVARLKAAIADREEQSGRRVRSRPAGTDHPARPAATAGLGVDAAEAPSSDRALDAPPLPRGSSSADSSGSSPAASPSRGLVRLLHRGGEETPRGPGDKHIAPSAQESEGLPQHSVSSQAEDGSGSSDSLIADRLQRITIADQGEQVSGGQAKMGDMRGLRRGPPKKPHYMEVLEARAQNPVPVLHKFKTNVLPSQLSDGAHGLCQGRESPISSEERRRQDKQHLDDVTAARLLPLHHKPAQLLSIEESLALQKQQKQNYEEMQAKLAAQKLAERVNVKMQSYDPEGAALRRYREARDEDDQSSDDGL